MVDLRKITLLSLVLFVLSLPFNAIEWPIIGIDRFELKITMITFLLLSVSWLLGNLKFPGRRNSKEILLYFFAFMYGISLSPLSRQKTGLFKVH